MKFEPRKDDDEKLRELTIYIACKSQQDPKFGATKLNKILFYADFLAYVKLGESITGAEYQKLGKGPAPRRLLPIQERMEGRDCVVQRKQHFKYIQKRLVPLRDPDLSAFTGEQIALVDELIDLFCDQGARALSDLTHELASWKAFSLNETIPYETAFIDSRPLTQAERDYALKLRPALAI